MPLSKNQSPRATTVAVFGGGVAGLTAAHELGRRGFKVVLYEKTDVLGGMAASQYLAMPSSLAAPISAPAISGGVTAAGEHGFRFFPAYYRHLGDTLGRIPLFVNDDPAQGLVSPRSSVADRLIPTNTQGVALEDGRDLFTYSRGRSNKSMEALLDELATSMDYLGATDQDIARLLFKIVEYMTSSEPRRRALEDITWWDFVDGPKFSAPMQRYLNTVPRALVAMSATEADARTQGTTLLQLFLDQFGDARDVDRTLDGPTTERWIKPWEIFLEERLGVSIQRNVAFRGLVPNPGSYGALRALTSAGPVDADAYVLALPHQTLKTILASNGLGLTDLAAMDMVGPVQDDSLLRLRDFPSTTEAQGGPLATLSGLQYYLPNDVRMVPGHVYYPDSAWGLSSVSQAQFWGEGFPHRFERGGVLSVDIGDFKTPSTSTGKTVLQSTRDEIAAEVWRQLRTATAGNQFLRVDGARTRWPGELPATPPSWMIDDRLVFDSNGLIKATTALMLINRPGEFRLRPGHPEFFRAHVDQIALAGPWTQTYTRLTTMEAANESARHAVNGLLAAVDFQGEYCTIWNPEDHEPVPMNRLKGLDARLAACGVPHVFEVLGIYGAIDCLVPTTPHSHGEHGLEDPVDCCPPDDGCCEPTPLDRLMTLTGLDMHGLAAVFELCPEDLLEAERRVKNTVVEQKLAGVGAVRGLLEGRPSQGTLLPEHWELLAKLAGRELQGQLLAMMQSAGSAMTAARSRAEEPDAQRVAEREDVPILRPLSKPGLALRARLVQTARGRWAETGRQGKELDREERMLEPLIQLYLPGYLVALLATPAGAAWHAAWVAAVQESDERPEGWEGAPDLPDPESQLNLDALAEADRLLPGLFPRPPAGSSRAARPMTVGPDGAPDERGTSSARPIGAGLPPDAYLTGEIAPNLTRPRPYQHRKQRALPAILATLADRS